MPGVRKAFEIRAQWDGEAGVCLMDAISDLAAFRRFALEIASTASIAQFLGQGQGAAP